MTRTHDELVLNEKFLQQIPQIKRVAEGTWREQIAIALCHLSIEHHSGLITLIQERQLSPALAMFRPQMEAWLRSMWVSQQAPEKELQAFMKGEEFVLVANKRNGGVDKKKRIPPPIREIIERVRDDVEREALLSNYDSTWKSLCDMTHGGPLQVNARLQAHGIETIYPDLHIGGLVHASTRLAYLAMMEMAEVLHDPELRDGIHELFLSIYPTPHVMVGKS
ncbi:DUF6988 family protein [Variovorax sp. LT1R16]|uniref:DUF6988 family protein n=1 Tax=Variovorax sp. LT1R16 TaxID=3443728 RepID=UPI003F48C30C